MKTTEENNKMIAEFMGWRNIICEELDGIEAWFFDDIYQSEVGLEMYHTSWDWLMPVVEKIGRIPNKNADGLFKFMVNVDLSPIGGCKIIGVYRLNFKDKDDVPEFDSYNEDSFLLNTYNCVVQFIEWYNQQNQYICGSCGEHCLEYTYNEDKDIDECNNCK